MKPIRFLKVLYMKGIELIDPVRRAKMEGVRFGERLHIYGHVKWGSEPWIIKIGDDVHITDGKPMIDFYFMPEPFGHLPKPPIFQNSGNRPFCCINRDGN